MIKQVFNIRHYWEVRVYYNTDFDLFDVIEKDLKDCGISKDSLRELYNVLYNNQAKAVTFSNLEKHLSIVLFCSHQSKADYINSIVHEAEHVKQAMLQAYQIQDKGEPPAYTIGYLVGKMWEVFKGLVCDECDYR